MLDRNGYDERGFRNDIFRTRDGYYMSFRHNRDGVITQVTILGLSISNAEEECLRWHVDPQSIPTLSHISGSIINLRRMADLGVKIAAPRNNGHGFGF